jgi:hypothetical protein
MGNKLFESGIIKTLPQKWTKKMEQDIVQYRKDGLNLKQISHLVKRSETSISIKIKRLTKKDETYNSDHRMDKYKVNQEFLQLIKPESLLDLYAGTRSFYEQKVFQLVSNDIFSISNTDYHEKAINLLYQFCLDKREFDIIDLDPFGSAIEEFHLAIKLAKKGIIITLGEMGALRFKRLDFVKRWYSNIKTINDFTSDNIIKELQRIASCYKKELIIFKKRDYNRISRIWFIIKPLKIKVWEEQKGLNSNNHYK